MSGWRIVTKELARAGKPMKCSDVADSIGQSPQQAHRALNWARYFGLADKQQYGIWHLTDKGRAYVAGEIRTRRAQRAGYVWEAA